MKTTSRFGTLLLLVLPFTAAAQQKVMLPAADKPLRERPAPVFAIGAEDGEDWELLSGVRQVAFDARDNLYVLDGNNHRVLVFDANGRFVRKIGKKGGGPGEFMAPIAMTINTDGNIVVNDLGRRAYSIFKPDGSFVKNVTLEDAGEGRGGFAIGGGMGNLRPHPKGGVVVRNTETGMPRLDGGQIRAQQGAPVVSPGATGPRTTTFDWIDLATGKSKTLFEFELPSLNPKVDDQGGGAGERRVTVMIQIPTFTPQISFGGLQNGGLAVAHEADYRIKVINPNGGVGRVIERGIRPKKVTDADKKQAVERRIASMKAGRDGIRVNVNNGATSFSSGGPPPTKVPTVDELLRTTTFLEYIPVLSRIETDPTGRIWAQRFFPDQDNKGPVDLFTGEGRYIGTITNDRAPDAVSRSGRAAYIQRDELGVEQVVVKRLPATWK